MKRLYIHLSSFFLIFILVLSFSSIHSNATLEEIDIYTRITDIVLPPEVTYREYAENWTVFTFNFTFEIINPGKEVVIVPSTTTCLFYLFSNLSFENEQYMGEAYLPRFCGQAFTDHPIDPGIANMTYVFTLAVNASLLENIPNGNFSFWIYLDDYMEQNDYHNYISEISVNGTDIQITHQGENVTFNFPEETTPIITLVKETGMIFSALIISIMMGIRRKKK